MILLMIPNRKEPHYPTVKKLFALSRGIARKMLGFSLLKMSLFIQSKKELQLHKKICVNNIFCLVVMPSEDRKILDFNQYWKFDETSSIIFADLESLIKEVDSCKRIPNDNLQKKYLNIFPVDIQCLQYGHYLHYTKQL